MASANGCPAISANGDNSNMSAGSSATAATTSLPSARMPVGEANAAKPFIGATSAPSAASSSFAGSSRNSSPELVIMSPNGV